jgi:DNA-binding FadR family transcriptional regulator
LALGQFDQTDVLETRLALETWSAREASLRAAAVDFECLAGILDSMDDPEVTTAEFNRLDTAFHVRIAESTGNALTAHLMQSLRFAINRQMVEAYARLDDWRATAETVRREHRELLDSLRRREPDVAARCMQDHITDFYALGDVGGTSSSETRKAGRPQP